jgi:hypothetical protein
MKTLYEELKALDREKMPQESNSIVLRPEFDQAEIFNIQNVADYFYDYSGKEDWSLKDDIPNIAPPFQTFYMEFRFPEYVIIDGDRKKNPAYGGRGGILFSAETAENIVIDPRIETKWHVKCGVVVEYKKVYQHLPIIVHLFIDKDGKYIRMPQGNVAIEFPKGAKQEKEYWFDLFYDKFYYALFPALLAVSFLHCKNVKIISNSPRKSPSGRNRHNPCITFKTLEIEPMKRILRDEGQSETNGLKRALHICRGHFKTYEGAGLFGKYPGTYWWDSQVRGKVENGIVVKDYSVKPE